MERIFVLIEWRSDMAVLKDDGLGREILWPKENLPSSVKIGDKINFLISLNDLEIIRRKQFAKDILNEILT